MADEELSPEYDNQTIDEARYVLLEYYRDQGISHATIMLTLGLIAFAGAEGLKDHYSSFIGPLFVALASIASWQLLRFVYYGRVAGHTMHRKAYTKRFLEKYMAQKKHAHIFKDSLPTDIYALYESVEDYSVTRDGLWYELAHPLSRETWKEKAAFTGYAGGFFLGVAWFVRELLALLEVNPVFSLRIPFLIFLCPMVALGAWIWLPRCRSSPEDP